MSTLVQSLTFNGDGTADGLIGRIPVFPNLSLNSFTINFSETGQRVLASALLPAGTYFNVMIVGALPVSSCVVYGLTNSLQDTIVVTNPNTFSSNKITLTQEGYLIFMLLGTSSGVIEIYNMENDGVISLDVVKETIDSVELPANTAGGATMQSILDKIKGLF